ncbi:MAG TPA: hypothetical protein VH912_32820 [Streptosporangiaceae bacterium]|jgi:hypothetical protein
MAGYSGTPLPKKLGIKAGHRLLLAGAPDGFALDPLPGDVTVDRKPDAESYDVIVAFCPDQAALTGGFADWRARLDPAGGLWIAWPKKSSGVPTDLTENVVREVGLAQGVVDNKVCAIDDTWSGLRLVVRLGDR